MNWEIREKQNLSEADVDRLGHALLSGNGLLGLRGVLDEDGREAKAGLLLNGVYDRVPGRWREPVNVPYPMTVRLFCDGQEISARRNTPKTHEQGLDFRRGVQFRRSVFSDPKVEVNSRRFVSAAEERLVVGEYSVTTGVAASVAILVGLDADVWDLNGPHFLDFDAREDDGALRLSTRTQESGRPVDIVLRVAGPSSCRSKTWVEAGGIRTEYLWEAKPGVRTVFHLFATVGDDRAEKDTETVLARDAEKKGFAVCLEESERRWEERWKEADVVVNGDEDAQRALRFSLYHLMAAAPFFGGGLSIPARGLSGQVYKGAIFWDTELFMFPFFLNAFPEVAKTLVRYRQKGLVGAREKALEVGRLGAFYAWESQEEGRDACTLFNVDDVFSGRPMRTFFRDRQIHISADVVWAHKRLFDQENDDGLWLEGGAEVVYEVARFYLSWAVWRPSKNRWELDDVTGPDEYHERVDADFYTLVLARHALETCRWLDERLLRVHPQFWTRLRTRLGWTEADDELLREVLSGLALPGPDSIHGAVPQFEGYFDLDDVGLIDLQARKLHPHEYLGGGNGLARWTQVIKQADVVLADAIFPCLHDEAVVRADWSHYEPRTEHGSSLSACAYALVAARLGLMDEAYRYFLKTATADLNGETKLYVGSLYIGGTHPAANGGAWLSAVQGFGGVSTAKDSIVLDPHLPAAWKSLQLVLRCGNRRFRATLFPNRVELETERSFDEPLTVHFDQCSLVWEGKDSLVLCRDPAPDFVVK